MSETEALEGRRFGGRFDDEGPGLRERTARGTLVNAAFMVGLASLGFLRTFLVPIFLTVEEYGVWGILVITLGTLSVIKQVGITDKFIQQDEEDQERAFQKAFTLDTLMNVVLLAAVLIAAPLFALGYDRPELLAPGLALAIAVPAASLQAPLWVYYRQMRFVRQRTLAAINPIVSLAVTLGLAAAGFGYWSLVIGQIAGVWIAGAVAAALSPYPLRFRYDRGTLREYYSFSWPLFVASGSGFIVAQISVFAGETKLGLAGAGAIALASSIAIYAQRVDAIVTQTLYPAVCAVKDRTDLLFESFVKSNRLALMWGVPFGVGLALFAPDLVERVFGEKWEPAVGLIQAFGLIAAANQIGFNWTAFFRARGETLPMAAVGALNVIVFLVVAVPMLFAWGLDGYALGMAIVTAVHIVQRGWYLSRLFPAFAIVTHSVRAILPVLPGTAAVLLLRLAEGGDRSGLLVGGELLLFAAVTVAVTLVAERALVREMIGYVRGVRAQPA